MRAVGAALALGIALALVACGPPEPATERLVLGLSTLPADVDRVVLRLGEAEVADLTPPWPEALELVVAPGPQPALVLEAFRGGQPVWLGTRTGVVAEAGALTVVELPLDPAGRLTVGQAGVGLGGLFTAEAFPRAPPPGTPLRYPLPPGPEGPTGILPAGIHDLVVVIDGLGPRLGSLGVEVEVLQGRHHQLVDLNFEPVGAARSLEVSVPLGVALPAPSATVFTVTARDANGAIALGYTGRLSFSGTPPGLALPAPAVLSGGPATFELVAPVGYRGPVEVVVTSEDGLRGAAQASVVLAP